MDRHAKLIGSLVAILVLTPVALAFAAWLWLDVKSGRELHARLAALRAAGKPLTVAEATPKPVPDDQNAALLYQQVLQVDFHARSSRQEPMDWLPRQDSDLISRYIRHPDRAADAKVRKVLSRPKVLAALATLDRASRKPYCVFPLDWSAGVFMPSPHHGLLGQAETVVAARAVLSARDGNVDDALKWAEVVFRISLHIASEPQRLSQVVAWSRQTRMLRALCPALSEADVPSTASEPLDSYLRGVDLQRSFLTAMETERANILDLLSNPRSYTSPNFHARTPKQWAWLLLRTRLLDRPFRNREQIVWLDYTAEFLDAAKEPYYLAAPKLKACCERSRGYCTLSGGEIEAVTADGDADAVRYGDECIASVSLLRIGLALKADKARTGSYPATLAALRKTLDWKLPKDPFSGKDFVYRRKGNGFIVYSLGPNMRDDGGLPDFDASGRRRDNADIVWECTR